MCTHFNGTLKEILEKYPNIDMTGYLADKLQLPLDKAEILTARIEKQICQKAPDNKGQKVLRILQKPIEAELPKTSVYPVDCLSKKEFKYFTKWLLSELGYKIQPEKHPADWCFNLVVGKDDIKVAVQALRCRKTHRLLESIVLLAQQAKSNRECHKAIVIATAYFTEQAKSEAENLGVELWDLDTLAEKITEIRERINVERQTYFPNYRGSLLPTLLALGETKNFLIEPKADGKYEVHLPGVKYPLLTFQAQNGEVIRCVFRIKYNEPVPENVGEAVISTDDVKNRVGADDIHAYELVTQYLEQFLE